MVDKYDPLFKPNLNPYVRMILWVESFYGGNTNNKKFYIKSLEIWELKERNTGIKKEITTRKLIKICNIRSTNKWKIEINGNKTEPK